jgi:hypothetical protein
MVTNEVNKFGQIFPSKIQGYDFTPKSHLRRIILCQGYFFLQTCFRITLYQIFLIL